MPKVSLDRYRSAVLRDMVDGGHLRERTTFWEIILNNSPDEIKAQMKMVSHFAKVNSMFMSKKPAEVSQGFLRVLSINPPTGREHSKFQSHRGAPLSLLYLRILIIILGHLVTLLSPQLFTFHPHCRFWLAHLISHTFSRCRYHWRPPKWTCLQSLRELASKKRVETLVDYMLSEFARETYKTPTALNREELKFKSDEHGVERETDDCAFPFPTYDSSIFYIVQSMSLPVELIWKNI